MQKRPKIHTSVSVVVPAYNEQETLGALLASLSTQTTTEFEVVVVNNASTDRTREVAEQYAGKLNLKIIDEPHKGRGSARATGFASAQGQFIFSTDADVVAPPNWISSLLSHFSREDIVAVSGTCQVDDLRPLDNFMVNNIQPLGMRMFSLVYGTPWLTGSNFAIRREAYEKSGGFDRSLTAFEDAELAFHVKKQGQIKMVTDIPVTTSGRRFAHDGLVKGTLSYGRFLRLHHLHQENVTLDDPR